MAQARYTGQDQLQLIACFSFSAVFTIYMKCHHFQLMQGILNILNMSTCMGFLLMREFSGQYSLYSPHVL